MRRALVLLLALAGCRSYTDVVVRVHAGDLTVPADIARLQVTVFNPTLGDGGGPAYQSQALPLCGDRQHDGCYRFPVTVTLTPGPLHPEAPVRVQVTAFDAAGAAVSDDATVFSFTPDHEQSLDFFLSRACLHTSCADSDRACNGGAGCVRLAPTQGEASAPDLATTSSLGDIRRVSVVPDQSQGPDGIVTVVPPDAQPGDQVIVAFNFHGRGGGSVVPPPGWLLVGQAGETACFHRVAGAAEASAAATYQFQLGTSSAETLTLVYRGVRQLLPVSTRVQSLILGGGMTVVVPVLGIPDAPPGAVAVGVLLPYYDVACRPSAGMSSFLPVGSQVFEVRGAANLSADQSLACSTSDNAIGGVLYELLLEPS